MLAAPPVLAQDAAPDAERLRSAAQAANAAATAAAEAAKAAAPSAAAISTAAPPPTIAQLTPPPAATAPPALTFAAARPEPAQDLLGNPDGMPVASASLLARLSADPAPANPAASTATAAPAAPLAPTATPVFRPAEAAPPPAPIATPTVLAALGAAPVALPSAAALEAAIAAQTTPIPPPRAETPAAPVSAAAPAPRAEYASFAPRRSRRSANAAGNARFMRAVVSTAAVSIEMPDVGRQVSPLGLLLGQLVTSQETPGSQYGLQEEMAMPTRPRLMAMPEVAIPQSFCSAEQRGAFMEGVYQPALAIAQHNSEVAAAYVRRLRTLYDNYQLSGDTRAQGAIAAEARDFARTANAAGSIQDEISGQFEDIMTTPVSTCGASQ
ncbi:hypothetical protein AQZ52_14965 [Novosphingobium fuchskuhlense]|uniref:Uncharacterized protein n=1 Tax=Novosphingobium fuchskuhlense TaxID=1117702 RepID=A0A124JTH0_9SPHN|nr:hypothetical protein AQZ52_14965 [Novosphingobium fuchskuhlense]